MAGTKFVKTLVTAQTQLCSYIWCTVNNRGRLEIATSAIALFFLVLLTDINLDDSKDADKDEGDKQVQMDGSEDGQRMPGSEHESGEFVSFYLWLYCNLKFLLCMVCVPFRLGFSFLGLL